MTASRLLLCLSLFAAASLVPAAGAATPAGGTSETMAERTLKSIIERQKSLLADAAKAGDKLDKESLRVQLVGLTHEYQLLIEQSPDFAPAYADFGYLLWKLEMRQDAMKLYLKADHLDPTIPLVKNELGNALAEDGKPLEAIDYFEAAARLDPDEPLYQYQIGTLLYEARDDFLKQGTYNRAQLDQKMHEAFHRAAELAPGRLEFTYRYAESFYDLATPDWEGAFAAWSALAAQAATPLERQTMELHEANVRLKQGRIADARAILAGVTEPTLSVQKQKLVAQLPENAKK